MDQTFRKLGYKIVRGAYDVRRHRPGLKDLFAYTKRLPAAAADTQSPGSPAFYREVEMTKVMLRLLPRVEAETGLSLYPTYAYLRRYGPGATLGRHRDRPACEISCTLCIGHEGDYSWPIWVQDLGGAEHEVVQAPGDLVIYRGVELDHWREPADERVICQSQVFLHYVDQDGPHQDEAMEPSPAARLWAAAAHKLAAKAG